MTSPLESLGATWLSTADFNKLGRSAPPMMPGMGPRLWKAAQLKAYSWRMPSDSPPFSRAYCDSVTRPLPASRLYYKWLDRIQLGLPL